jgi:hypothetical protein
LHLESLETRDNPDSGGALQFPSSDNLTYTSGPLIQNVAVEPIFLTDSQTGTTSAYRSQLNAFFNTITADGYISRLLGQYSTGGMTIGNGTKGSDDANVPVTPDAQFPGSPPVPVLTDGGIQSLIGGEIDAGRTAAVTANTVYVVFTPPGDAVTVGTSNSIQTFIGYHSSFTHAGQAVRYAVIPDQTSVNGNLSGLGLTAFQGETETSSHELAEAITDPNSQVTDPNTQTGWVGPGDEVGDQAAAQSYTLDGYQVQYEWSNTITGIGSVSGTGSADIVINQLSPPAVTGSAAVQVATFTDANPTAANFSVRVFTRIDVNGTLTDVPWTVQGLSGSNQHLVITATPPSSLAAGQYGSAFTQTGLYVLVSDASRGGFNSGAPLSVRYQPFTISTAAPLTYKADATSGPHNFTLKESGGNFVLSDNGTVVFTQAISQTTSINIGADPGASSSLALDYSGGVFNNPVSFDGGTGSGAHILTVDDSTDAAGHNVTVTGSSITGLTSGNITYSDTTNVTFKGGNGNTTVIVAPSTQVTVTFLGGTGTNILSTFGALNGDNKTAVLTPAPAGGSGSVAFTDTTTGTTYKPVYFDVNVQAVTFDPNGGTDTVTVAPGTTTTFFVQNGAGATVSVGTYGIGNGDIKTATLIPASAGSNGGVALTDNTTGTTYRPVFVDVNVQQVNFDPNGGTAVVYIGPSTTTTFYVHNGAGATVYAGTYGVGNGDSKSASLIPAPLGGYGEVALADTTTGTTYKGVFFDSNVQKVNFDPNGGTATVYAAPSTTTTFYVLNAASSTVIVGTYGVGNGDSKSASLIPAPLGGYGEVALADTTTGTTYKGVFFDSNVQEVNFDPNGGTATIYTALSTTTTFYVLNSNGANVFLGTSGTSGADTVTLTGSVGGSFGSVSVAGANNKPLFFAPSVQTVNFSGLGGGDTITVTPGDATTFNILGSNTDRVFVHTTGTSNPAIHGSTTGYVGFDNRKNVNFFNIASVTLEP